MQCVYYAVPDSTGATSENKTAARKYSLHTAGLSNMECDAKKGRRSIEVLGMLFRFHITSGERNLVTMGTDKFK